jgi:hypothetical protein
MSNNQPTQFPVSEKGKVYDKLPHKFEVGETVTLPGDRIRGPQYKNQFLYNKEGVIERRGWSKEPTPIKDKKIDDPKTGGYWWSKRLVHQPTYRIDGRWYGEGRNNNGIVKP